MGEISAMAGERGRGADGGCEFLAGGFFFFLA